MELGRIDRLNDRPPYRQIADHLRAAIDAGQLGPGDRLPSEAELKEHYGVARMTARQAIQELRAEGRVVAEHGRGVFVRQPPPVRRLASDRFAREHRGARTLALHRRRPDGYCTGRVHTLAHWPCTVARIAISAIAGQN